MNDEGHNAASGRHTGQPSTALSEALERAVLELGPDRSLLRVESTSKFVLATVSSVGAALAAFAALASDVVKDHPWLSLPSMLLIVTSVALAAWAVIGVGDEVDLDDLDDVEDFYRREIETRGTLVRWSGGLLALGLALAILPAIGAALGEDDPKQHEPRVTAALQQDGAASTLAMAVDAGPVDEKTTATLTARAGKQLLVAGRWVPRDKRHFSFATTAKARLKSQRITVVVTIQQPKKAPVEKRLRLPPP